MKRNCAVEVDIETPLKPKVVQSSSLSIQIISHTEFEPDSELNRLELLWESSQIVN